MGRGEVHTKFWWGNLREGDHWEDLGLDGRVILSGSSITGMGGMEWIDLAQDNDRCRAAVNTVMKLWVP
jgi:hypothetical protein